MNIIKMYNDYVNETIIDSEIEITKIRKNEFFSVNKLKLRIKKDTDVLIIYEGDKDYKLDFYLEIDENVTCNIKDIRVNVQSKVRNTYILKNKSKLSIERFLNLNKIRLLDIVNLDEDNSSCEIKSRNLSNIDNKYDAIIYHNAEYTNLNIDYKSLNNANENVNITDIIANKIKNYKANHKVKILDSNKENCTVNAYILVDENKTDEYSFVNISSLEDEINNISKIKKLLESINIYDRESIIENNSLEKLKEYWRVIDE